MALAEQCETAWRERVAFSNSSARSAPPASACRAIRDNCRPRPSFGAPTERCWQRVYSNTALVWSSWRAVHVHYSDMNCARGRCIFGSLPDRCSTDTRPDVWLVSKCDLSSDRVIRREYFTREDVIIIIVAGTAIRLVERFRKDEHKSLTRQPASHLSILINGSNSNCSLRLRCSVKGGPLRGWEHKL